jgi:hypothetical protein
MEEKSYVQRDFRNGNFGGHHIIQEIGNVSLHKAVTSKLILLGLFCTCSLPLNQNVLGESDSASL